MKVRKTNSVDVIETLSLTELCGFCGARQEWVVELVEFGVVQPLGDDPQSWEFDAPSIARARKARRLARDLEINVAGLAVVLDLLAERDHMMRRLAQYEQMS